ncbi:MAG: hydantoinase B/oxoprolinase family protein [Acidimicrobiia bacterium]|nr:hydantoinase B/oxoprolinase family protein [Acidimicrobiia bacterium]
MTNTKNTPIEALERSFPLRVLRYRLRRGSGGGELVAAGCEARARAEHLPDKCTIQLRAGDVLRMLTPSGGWGRASTG